MKREHIYIYLILKFTKASGIFETDLVAVAMNTTMTSRIFETETVLDQVTW